MANATKREKVVVVEGVTLELTANEAQFLADLTALIGGHPRRSRRRYADTINLALGKAGVHEAARDVKDLQDGPGPALYFNELSEEVPE